MHSTFMMKVAAMAAVVSWATTSEAATVDIQFDGGVSGTSYSEAGYTFTGTNLVAHTGFGDPLPSMVLRAETPGVFMTRTDGSTFDLFSFSGLCLNTSVAPCPTNISVVGTNSAGDVVGSRAFEVTTQVSTIDLTPFTNEFTDLATAAFLWDNTFKPGSLGIANSTVDSIVASAPPVVSPPAVVPLPASIGFLAVALGGLLGFRRRQSFPA